MKLGAGTLLVAQNRARYDALVQRIGSEALVDVVRRFDDGRGTHDLFLIVERAGLTAPSADDRAARASRSSLYYRRPELTADCRRGLP